MAQRVKLSGTRSPLLWLLSLLTLAILGASIVVLLIWLPQRQLEQHYQAGVAFQNVEDWEMAADSFVRVIQLDADYKDTQSRLAVVKQAQATARSGAVEVAPIPTVASGGVSVAAGDPDSTATAESQVAAATATASALRVLQQDEQATATTQALAMTATKEAQNAVEAIAAMAQDATATAFVISVNATMQAIDIQLAKNQATQTAVAAQPMIATQSPPTYDDEFDSAILNPNWSWWNENQSKWSLETVPGRLQITTTGGDMAQSCNNFQNLLLQEAPPRDFQIQTKVYINPYSKYQQGGLIIFSDPDNYVKLDVVWSSDPKDGGNAQGNFIELLPEQNGEFPIELGVNWPYAPINIGSEGLFLRIEKRGSWYTGSYSVDGKEWLWQGTVTAPAIVNPRMGLMAVGGVTDINNCTHTAPDIPVYFDFFRVTK